MRISIAFKIFGIALTLLALLTIAAVLSTYNVGRVADEVESIGRYFAPLTQAASHVQIRQLQQALVFERLLLRYDQVQRADASVAIAESEFADLGRQIDAEVSAALQLIAEGRAAATARRRPARVQPDTAGTAHGPTGASGLRRPRHPNHHRARSR